SHRQFHSMAVRCRSMHGPVGQELRRLATPRSVTQARTSINNNKENHHHHQKTHGALPVILESSRASIHCLPVQSGIYTTVIYFRLVFDCMLNLSTVPETGEISSHNSRETRPCLPSDLARSRLLPTPSHWIILFRQSRA